MSGELATQTPPWPTAMPEGMFSPSAKTVNLSALPSPSVSSRTLTRSRPGPGLRRGYSRLSVIQIRPRLVEGHGHRVDDVGLAGDDLDREPFGDGHLGDRLVRRESRSRRPVLGVRDDLVRLLSQGCARRLRHQGGRQRGRDGEILRHHHPLRSVLCPRRRDAWPSWCGPGNFEYFVLTLGTQAGLDGESASGAATAGLFRALRRDPIEPGRPRPDAGRRSGLEAGPVRDGREPGRQDRDCRPGRERPWCNSTGPPGEAYAPRPTAFWGRPGRDKPERTDSPASG